MRKPSSESNLQHECSLVARHLFKLSLHTLGLSQVYWRSRTRGGNYPTELMPVAWLVSLLSLPRFSLFLLATAQSHRWSYGWINKIFVQFLYKEENSQVHNGPRCHRSNQHSLGSCLQKEKMLVCIKAGMRSKTEEILPLWEHVYKSTAFSGLTCTVFLTPSHKGHLQI